MSIARIDMASPFRWLSKALDVGRRHPGALLGGFALFLLLALLPTALQLAAQVVFGNAPTVMLVTQGVSMVLGLLIFPPVMGGAFRLIHACETGGDARATDVFALYRDPPMAVRMMLLALLLLAFYLALFGLLLLLPGGSYLVEFMKVAITTPQGQVPALPTPPAGFLLWLLAFLLVAVIASNANMFAYTQASLGDRGPVQALRDGLLATLSNLLPLLGLALVLILGGFVVMIVLALLLALVLGALMLISPVLATVVAVPIYLGLMLVAYVVMFGFYYHGWREIFAADLPGNDGSELAV